MTLLGFVLLYHLTLPWQGHGRAVQQTSQAVVVTCQVAWSYHDLSVRDEGCILHRLLYNMQHWIVVRRVGYLQRGPQH